MIDRGYLSTNRNRNDDQIVPVIVAVARPIPRNPAGSQLLILGRFRRWYAREYFGMRRE